MKIKKLNTKHFWALVSMIRKGGKDAILQMQVVNQEDGTDDMTRGMVIFDVLMEHAEKDLKAMFADLAGFDDIREFENAPFELTLEIMEHLVENEDLPGFFKRAANFAKKFLPKQQTA